MSPEDQRVAIAEIREVLEFFKAPLNYAYASGMSPADKEPRIMRSGRLKAKYALEILSKLEQDEPRKEPDNASR